MINKDYELDLTNSIKIIQSQLMSTLGLIDNLMIDRLLEHYSDLDDVHLTVSDNHDSGYFTDAKSGSKVMKFTKKVSYTPPDRLNWDSDEYVVEVSYEVYDYITNEYLYLED